MLREVLLLGAAAGVCFAQTPQEAFFESKIRPVLAQQCFGCHSAKLKKPMGGLVLDTKAGTRHVVEPGKPAESSLLLALEYKEGHIKMPPAGKLDDRVIADFRQWIAYGAADPRQDAPAAAPAGKRQVGDRELAAGRSWWAYQPAREVPLPAGRQSTWGRNRLDAFVLAGLEKAGLQPSPEADSRTLAIRLHLDLTGVRPSIAELESYSANPSPDKYERLVDKLLASPAYGERWGRYWLDVARYAEDNVGAITNPPYPYAWRYRDWVIDAFNKDLPYDRFVQLQLAADLLPATSRADLAALGFLGLGPMEHKDGRLSAEVVGGLYLNDIDERVDAVSRGLLGMTVSCARCHDHKFDPIPTRDYYRLKSVFASTQRATRPTFAMAPADETRFMWMVQRLFDLHYMANLMENESGSKPEQSARQAKKFRAEIATLETEMDGLGAKYPEIAAYLAETRVPSRNGKKERWRGLAGPNAPFTNSVYDAGMWLDNSEPDLTFLDYKPGVPRDLPVYRGGNINSPGETAPRGFLTVLSKGDGAFHNGSGRAELSQRIFSDAPGLAARVMVNRVWGWHFDKHLAATPSDLGTQGEKPTHPELLDDLAARWIASGWSLKWLHREILLSATYRQASRPRAEALEKDPANKLLWRMNPRRLDVEAYRDSMLAAAGKLDHTRGGQPEDLDQSLRRTVYARWSRGRQADLLRLYDVPEAMLHIPQRVPTISPAQQLFVMNSPFVRARAAELAQIAEPAASPEDKVRILYRRILSREPDAAELDFGLTYLRQSPAANYAQALLATNEVIFWP